jgi:hypothetical protein
MKVIDGSKLRSGAIKSCGCFRREYIGAKSTTHGLKKTKAYQVWASMKARCLNPSHEDYHNYGGRGITVCEEWLSFESFFKDMGHPSRGQQLDRIKNHLGYFPGNCEWRTCKQNCRNKRSNVVLTHNGESKCMIEWAEQAGLKFYTFSGRIKAGWTMEKALTKPVQKRRQV